MDADLARRLASLVGDRHVLTGVECSPFVLEGRTPEAVVFPGSRDEVGGVEMDPRGELRTIARWTSRGSGPAVAGR